MSRLSLRARLLVVGATGVLVALLLGSLALYGVLDVVGYRTLDRSAASTAAEVADLVTSGRLPDPIPVTGSQLVQVVDPSGRVVSASVNADRLTALLRPAEVDAALAGWHPVVPGARVGLDAPLRASARQVTPSRIVVVAQDVGDLRRSQHLLRFALLVLFPLLLLVLVLIASRVISAVLRPVEALRSTADRISGGTRTERLPVPASQDEIHDLAVTLNSMLDRLAAAREREETFVADAAHELRSPLASLRTQLEVAERLGHDAGLTRDLLAEVLRMAALVEDLLALARSDQERAFPAEPIPLRSLVAEAVRRHADAAVPVAAADVAPVAVSVVPGELDRVLDNLIENAVRHARHAVTLTATDVGAEVEIAVADDGAGIGAADRDRVFERFTRLDEARDRDAGGSGLGLAIVRTLVERNGGRIELDDAAGGGLAARLRFPVAGATNLDPSAADGAPNHP